MAFVSMMLAFLAIFGIIIIGILILLMIAGLVLLIVGIVKRKKAVSLGKKYPYVLITLGSILLSLPLLLIIGVFIYSAVAGLEKDIVRQGYDNCIDKWRNEWVSSNEVRDDIIEEFFEAADNKDKEVLMALYSDEIQDDDDYLIAGVDVLEDIETRRVGGNPVIYEHPDRIYTREEVLDAIRNSYDLQELYDYIGEPNAMR